MVLWRRVRRFIMLVGYQNHIVWSSSCYIYVERAAAASILYYTWNEARNLYLLALSVSLSVPFLRQMLAASGGDFYRLDHWKKSLFFPSQTEYIRARCIKAGLQSEIFRASCHVRSPLMSGWGVQPRSKRFSFPRPAVYVNGWKKMTLLKQEEDILGRNNGPYVRRR